MCVCVCVCVLSSYSNVHLFATLWATAHQAPLSMGFSRHEFWKIAMPSSRGSSRPRDPTISLMSPALQADSLPTGQLGKTFAEKFYMHSNIERVGND